MKKHLSKKSLWQSLLSVMALGIIIFLAVGTSSQEYDLPDFVTDFLGHERYRVTRHFIGENYYTETEGIRDKHGQWQGPVTIKHISNKKGLTGTEEVSMIDGTRHGVCKTTWSDGKVVYHKYNMGIFIIDPNKAAQISAADYTAFQALGNKYPWFLYSLNAFGYEDEYIEAYLDTLETVLGTYEFEVIDFNDYYQDVIDSLEETVYDSIITLNTTLSIFQGLEELKNAELRLAVIDRYRSDGNSTYNIVETTYPGYLLSMNDAGVNDQDFEGFCQDMDSLLTSYGSLDLEDPFFIDSVDVRMFRAMEYIYETEESSLKAMLSMKSAAQFSNNKDFRGIYNEVNSILKQLFLKSSPSDVVEVVLAFMLPQFDQGDIIKRAVREAYFNKKGVISVPTVTTVFSGNNSATSVTLHGYVIEDGGAAVTTRGIAWATFYNPTTNDHAESSGTGTGDFTVTLTGLTEGATYYARTYATNSAGTAYGNCIYFTAISSVGINDHKTFAQDFNVYPNPASALTIFSFQVESSESMVLTITNLKGQVVYHNDLGSLPQGENRIELDLSGLQDGVYSCQLTSNGRTKGKCKLVVVR